MTFLFHPAFACQMHGSKIKLSVQDLRPFEKGFFTPGTQLEQCTFQKAMNYCNIIFAVDCNLTVWIGRRLISNKLKGKRQFEFEGIPGIDSSFENTPWIDKAIQQKNNRLTVPLAYSKNLDYDKFDRILLSLKYLNWLPASSYRLTAGSSSLMMPPFAGSPIFTVAENKS